jgi:hypothetical protein
MGMMPPILYLTSANAATVTGNAISLQPDNISAWQMQVVTTGGTLNGTFTFEVSNDPRANQYSGQTSSAQWTDITATLVQGISNPASSTVNFVAVPKTGIPWSGAYLRMKFTNSSGSGTINAWFSGASA